MPASLPRWLEAVDIPGPGVSAGNHPARCRHRGLAARPDQGAGRAGPGHHPAVRRQGRLTAQQIAVTQPQAWDVYDQWFNSVKIVWGAGVCQPVDVTRLPQWENVSPLTKVGKINDEAKVGAGDAPVRLLYVQPDGSLLSDPTEQVSMLPLTHNVDAFGYQSEVVDSEDAKSWAIFYDADYKGKVGLLNDPATGLMDLALGAQAAGSPPSTTSAT